MKMQFLSFLALGLLMGAASGAEFPLLYELEPLYNVLNITGWEAYPDCWVFPQPAITLVYEETTYQIALTYGPGDASGGKTVADAWCQKNGLDYAASFQPSDFSEGAVVRSIHIATGETCGGTPGRCSGFKFIECVSGTEAKSCGKSLPNNGDNNNGFGNEGGTNIGNFNNGSANVGDFNYGSANVGSFNRGSGDVGSFLDCSACKDAASTAL